jgi:hypothetical protein
MKIHTHTHSPTFSHLQLIIMMEALCEWTRSSTPGIRRLVLSTLVLGNHVHKLYSASTLVLFLSASCSWDGGSRASAQLTLNVHWMFTECSLNVHWMFTECSLNVHWMFTECSLNAHWMLTDMWVWGRQSRPQYRFGKTTRDKQSKLYISKEFSSIGWVTQV